MVEKLGLPTTPGEDPGVDWSAVRADYEAGELSLGEIAGRHGVKDHHIRYRREREGWRVRLGRRTEPGALVGRMLGLLDRQIRELERRMKDHGTMETGPGAEKDVALLSNMARTLEKLLELDAAGRAGRKGRLVPPIEDLREQLAKRLEALREP